MSEDAMKLKGLQPPQITDQVDNDPPDEVITLLGKEKPTNWPTSEVDVTALDKLFIYGLKLSRNKVLKAVGLAIVAGAVGILYTYILLNVR